MYVAMSLCKRIMTISTHSKVILRNHNYKLHISHVII